MDHCKKLLFYYVRFSLNEKEALQKWVHAIRKRD